MLANPQFGCLVTEGGLGYTWAGNSQMNRLTPWSNDPVSDPPGEVLYVREEDTGEFWTPTPLPLGPMGAVTVRHGQGYTRYTHASRDLEQDLLVFVPPADSVKLVRLTLRNKSDQQRHLSVTYYVEWVLGTARENAPLQVVCERDPKATPFSPGTHGWTIRGEDRSWRAVRRRNPSPPTVRSFSESTGLPRRRSNEAR